MFTRGRTRYRWVGRGRWQRDATVAEAMLAWAALRELRERRLTVVLIPAERRSWPGHKVRAVTDENPRWYQRLHALRCRCRPRKCRGGHVHRARVLSALSRAAGGRIEARGYEREILEVLAAEEAELRRRWTTG
jgi:hypothetical protein